MTESTQGREEMQETTEQEEFERERSRQEYQGWRQTLGLDQRIALVEDAVDQLLAAHFSDEETASGTLAERISALEEENLQQRQDSEKKADTTANPPPADPTPAPPAAPAEPVASSSPSAPPGANGPTGPTGPTGPSANEPAQAQPSDKPPEQAQNAPQESGAPSSANQASPSPSPASGSAG